MREDDAVGEFVEGVSRTIKIEDAVDLYREEHGRVSNQGVTQPVVRGGLRP